MAVTKGSTWSSLYDIDVEETMSRWDALATAREELQKAERRRGLSGQYEAWGRLHAADQILERMMDEIEEENEKS